MEERKKAVRAATRYWEEVHQRKEELKGATEVLADCRQSLLVAEKERDYAGRERDRVKADLEQANAFLQEKDKALQVTAREQGVLKAKMVAKVAEARVDAM